VDPVAFNDQVSDFLDFLEDTESISLVLLLVVSLTPTNPPLLFKPGTPGTIRCLVLEVPPKRIPLEYVGV
jgi:hypothetical protein